MRGILLLVLPVLAAQQATIRTNVPLVIAPTTVTDRHGKFVDGLGEEDFLVYDNSKRQTAHLDYALEPISLVIAVQSSYDAAAALDKIRKVGSMIEPLVLGDRGDAALITFDNEPQVVQDFTGDTGKISQAFRQLKLSDSHEAHMVDAISSAVQMLAGRPAGRRRVILLIAENRDRGSHAKLSDVVTEAQRANVTVFPLTYSAYLTPFTAKPSTLPPPDVDGINILLILSEISRLAKANAAEALAKYTGGRRISFLTKKSLERTIAAIAQELHSQYLLSFSPQSEDKDQFHELRIEVKDRPELRTRTRPGYWQ